MPKINNKYKLTDFDAESKARAEVANYIRKKVKGDKGMGMTTGDTADFNDLGVALTAVKQDLIKITNQLETPQITDIKTLNIGSIIVNIKKAFDIAKGMNFSALNEDDLDDVKDFLETFDGYKDILNDTLSFVESEVADPDEAKPQSVYKQSSIKVIQGYEKELFKLTNLLKTKILNYKSQSQPFIPEKPKDSYFNPTDPTERRFSQETPLPLYTTATQGQAPSSSSTISSKSSFNDLSTISPPRPSRQASFDFDALLRDFSAFGAELEGRSVSSGSTFAEAPRRRVAPPLPPRRRLSSEEAPPPRFVGRYEGQQIGSGCMCQAPKYNTGYSIFKGSELYGVREYV